MQAQGVAFCLGHCAGALGEGAKSAAHHRQITETGLCEFQRPGPAMKQGATHETLQCLDLLADRTLGHVQFARGPGKGQVARGRFEGA